MQIFPPLAFTTTHAQIFCPANSATAGSPAQKRADELLESDARRATQRHVARLLGNSFLKIASRRVSARPKVAGARARFVTIDARARRGSGSRASRGSDFAGKQGKNGATPKN